MMLISDYRIAVALDTYALWSRLNTELSNWTFICLCLLSGSKNSGDSEWGMVGFLRDDLWEGCYRGVLSMDTFLFLL